MRGLLITLEGIDGAGKSTQARMLADWLRQAGYAVTPTREPGGTKIGDAIRELVLSHDHAMPPEAELFLYLADRAAHVAEVLRPRIEAGDVVVCERFSDSTVAYQGYGRGLDLGVLRQFNAMATGGLAPDLTIVLDLQPSRARLDGNRLDRLESEGEEFSLRVAQGFRELARNEPNRIKLVDAAPETGVVYLAVIGFVQELLAMHGPPPGVLGEAS
jgi:dTMP kinase